MKKRLSGTNIFFKLNALKRIIWAFKKTFGITGDDTSYMRRAAAYNRVHDYKKALSTCKEAIYMNPGNYEAYYVLGNTYSRLRMYPDAVEAYKKAVGNKSKYAEALYRLSIAYRKLGKIKEASDAARRVMVLKPDMASGRHYGAGSMSQCGG